MLMYFSVEKEKRVIDFGHDCGSQCGLAAVLALPSGDGALIRAFEQEVMILCCHVDDCVMCDVLSMRWSEV